MFFLATTTIEESEEEHSPVKRPNKRSTKSKKTTPFTKVSRFSDSAPLSEKEDNVSPPKRSGTYYTDYVVL